MSLFPDRLKPFRCLFTALVVFFAASAAALPLLDFPSADDLGDPTFVQPFAGLQVESEVGGIGTTEPFFANLPDGVFPGNRVVNLAGNFQGLDPFGAPTMFDIAGVEVSNDLVNFFTPEFGQFNFAGRPFVTFSDSIDFDQVTFFATDPTLAFVFTGNPTLSYAYRLRTTGLEIGSFVVFDDVETTVRAIPEPSTLWLLALGLVGIFYISRRRFAPAVAALLLAFSGSLFAAPTLTRINPPIGQPGDVIVITGSGFSPEPAQNEVRFGPNRAAVRAATPTQLTVVVPNGQPLGPTRVTVDSSNSLNFTTIVRSKVVAPLNPAADCEDCGRELYCQDVNSSPRVSGGVFLVGTTADHIYGGEFFQPATDLFIQGRPGAATALHYRLRRQYRSAANNNGALGSKWDHSYFERLEVQPDGSVMHHNGLGRNDRYLVNNVGQFVAPPEFYTQLTRNQDGSFTLRCRDGTIKEFDGNGRITQVSDRNGNVLGFSYNAQNQLQTVTDTLGRPITYTYDGNGRLRQVTDFSGRTVTYTYDADGNLESATSPAVTGTPNGNDFPSGKTTRYTYDSSHRLLTITRPNEVASAGPPVLINVYDSSGKVVSQTYGGINASGVPAGGIFRFSYAALNAGVVSDDPNLPVMRTQQTDPNGNVTQYDYNRLGYVVVLREFTRGIRSTDPPVYVTTMTYNADGRLTRRILPAGNTIRYSYDEGNADRFQQGNMLSETRLPDAARGGDQTFITTSYTYEPIYNHIVTMTEPRGNDPSYVPQNGGSQSKVRYTTTYTYDAAGNRTKTQQPTVNLPGGMGPQFIQTDYTYNSFGQLTSETDPEGNVALYLYCATATPNCTTADLNGGGYLHQKIVDATTSPKRTESAPPAAIATRYFYDARGNRIRIIDGRGNDTLHTVNQLNQVVETRSEAPFRYITYTYYDANNNVIRKDTENKVATTTDGKPNFTGDGNFTTAAGTPAFFTNRYTYDILDKTVTADEDATASTPSRLITRYRYDANQNRLQQTLPSGNIIRYRYDERNLLFTQTRGFGSAGASTSTYRYDLNRNRAQEVDGRGNPTTYKYDGFDRRIIITDAVGGQTVTHYDPAANIISTSRFGQPGGLSPSNDSGAGNVLLRAQSSQYDELSRLFQDDDRPVNGSSFVASGVVTMRPPSVTPGPLTPGAISIRYIHDRNGRVVRRIMDDLSTTVVQYDGVNRQTAITDPEGNVATTAYDANSNVIGKVATHVSQEASVPNESFVTTYQYDAHNRQTSESDNCQDVRRYAYDSRDNMTDMTDAKADNTLGCPATQNAQGNSIHYNYDGMSRQLQTAEDLRVGGTGSGSIDTSNPFNPSGRIITRYTYDANSRRTSLVDGNGNATRFAYDALDRRTTETLADGTRTTYRYDAADNVVNLTDNNGTVQTHTYDRVDRRAQTFVTAAAGVIGTTLSTQQYDGLSRVTKATDNNDASDATSASTITLAYDSLGRVVEESQNGRAIDSAWFAQEQRTALIYPNNRQLDFTYDFLQRIQTIKDNGAPTDIARYTYIGPERVLEREYQNGTRLTFLDNAGTTDVGYDGVERMVLRRDLRSDDSLVVGFRYAYDRENNKRYEERLHSLTNSELYVYDSAYRIIDFQRGQLNATKTAITLPSRTQTWTLDSVGNWRVNTVNGVIESRTVNTVNEYIAVNGTTLLYDNNGNLTSDGVQGYQWDYKNRLRRICRLPPGATTCTALGAFLLATYSYDGMDRRTRKVVTNSGLLNGTTSFYYDDLRVVEERNGSDVVMQQYVYGIRLDEPVAVDRAGSERLFYHQNAIGSTFALTDTGGNVLEGYQYDAYGQQTVFGPGFGSPTGTVSAVGNPFMFTGQRLDPETGLMYYKHRYYSGLLGRFLSRDPMGYVDNHNLFEYVGDNPTKHTAPAGISE